MYNETVKRYDGQGISITSATVEACEPKREQLSSKCNEILSASRAIDSVADAIRSKLFCPQQCEASNGKEPYSVEDVLNMAKDILQSAYKTLQEINERVQVAE